MTEQLQFRAHARLLTMLGDQLIKNERIALVELVKNSYDADATSVTVDFQGFGEGFAKQPGSTIVITDDGDGMTPEIVKTAWMNPATPSKALRKSTLPATAIFGRVLQGEKGIGRFATFKLGSQVGVTTRARSSEDETTLFVDISDLDDAESPAQEIDFLLDKLHALFDVSAARVFVGDAERSTHGTEIEIGDLRADWSEALVESAYADLDRMQPQLWRADDEQGLLVDFEVKFLKDGVDMRLGDQRVEEFQAALDKAVLTVSNGSYDQDDQVVVFSVNGRTHELDLSSAEVRGLRPYRSHFRQKDNSWLAPSCGDFAFQFHVFDITRTAETQYSLDDDDLALVKSHRIYLYRDGIRVYPYGDPRDDWLEIDAIRGTQSAGAIFSNDQTLGYVSITQAGNPLLRDKTNREGLLENGRANSDFIALLQTILTYLRAKPYAQYAAAKARAREKKLKPKRIDKHISSLRNEFDLPPKALNLLDDLESALTSEREVSAMQIARTEQLAGVGMSVESASHDLIASGNEALRMARWIRDEIKRLDLQGAETVFEVSKALVTRLEFVNSRFKDVQGLFVSTRQKRRVHDIGQLTRRVKSMYSSLHKHEAIEFEIIEPLEVKASTTEAAILQCLINLVDNATYWLISSPHQPRLIRAFAVDDRTLAITDSGDGVKPQDEPYIFDAFYSGKGDAGKGLGLYIARENGLRNGFAVELADVPDERQLQGATFIVTFEAKENGS